MRTDDDSGGLYHLTAGQATYPLQLVPASLQEADEPLKDPGLVLRMDRSGPRLTTGAVDALIVVAAAPTGAAGLRSTPRPRA